ncbi:MAG: D-aminoacyl-tRNA deacylase [Candidatus Micrarchaeaceae archaeon]
MLAIVFSNKDVYSKAMGDYLLKSYETSPFGVGYKVAGYDICIFEEKEELYRVDAKKIEEKADFIVFLSRHSSEKEVDAATTHALGNFSREAKFGGIPFKLSVSFPDGMIRFMKKIGRIEGVDITYEATHHGPYTTKPSLFAEFSAYGVKDYQKLAERVASACMSAVFDLEDNDEEYTYVIGIGGTHYPRKFDNLALTKGYAFGHIISKYNIKSVIENKDLLFQAIEKNGKEIEKAIIDWKSIRSEERNLIASMLNYFGMDYERV